MARCLFIICMLLCSIGYSQQPTEKYTLYTYGHYTNSKFNALQITGKRWNIHFELVGLADVPSKLSDKVARHNYFELEELRKKYGIDWEFDFDVDFENEYKFQREARAVIQHDAFFKKARLLHDCDFLFLFTPKTKLTYNVDVVAYGLWDGKLKMLTYYTLTFNKVLMNWELQSDKIQLFSDS